MKQQTIEINYTVCQLEELPIQDKQLVLCAIQATHNSYAPYSQFHVGAACLLKNGKTVMGANQENAAFPSGLCAERTALFAAQANFPDQPVTTLAIAASNADGMTKMPISPCGACRQAILEVEDRYKKPIRILLYGKKEILCLNSIKDLLPFCFIDENMR